MKVSCTILLRSLLLLVAAATAVTSANAAPAYEWRNVAVFAGGFASGIIFSPAIYAIAERGGVRGVYRSMDGARSWERINADRHQWGLRFRAVTGDPRRFGRVYVATDGRGIIYGDPAR